jgi:hypothetical protein
MGFVTGRVVKDPPGFWVTFGEFRIKAWMPSLEGLVAGGVDVGLRPEDIVADPAGVAMIAGPGSYLGRHGFLQLQLVPGSFVDMRTSGVPPAPGSTVRVRLRRIHLFHPESGLGLGSVEGSAT